jgi:Bacterial Ig-like domain (group 3)
MLDALSCYSAGNCIVGADYGSAQGSAPFIVIEKNGVWGKPQTIPGMAALLGTQQAVVAAVTAVSCADSADCTVAGDFPSHGRMDEFISTETGSIGSGAGVGSAFLAKERSGAWIGGPRLITLSGPTSNPLVSDLSCVAKGYCTAAAFEQFPAKTVAKPTAYLIGEGAASRTTLRLSRSSVAFGKEGAEKLTIAVSGPAAAKVTVTAGKTAVCTVVLTASGKPGSCTLAAKALKPGTYRLVATYRGNAVHVASQSAAAKLTVLK